MLLIKYQTTDIPLLILHLLFMSSAYKDMFYARVTDSNWVPSIFVDIPAPIFISDLIPSYVDIELVGKTNIVPLMDKPSLQFEVILSHELKYPKGASFFFEGFNGVEDQHRLVSHIIDWAKKIDVTQLVSGYYNKTPSQKEQVHYYKFDSSH